MLMSMYNPAVEGDEPDTVVLLKLQQSSDLVVMALEQGGWLLEEHLCIWFHLWGSAYVYFHVRMAVVSKFYEAGACKLEGYWFFQIITGVLVAVTCWQTGRRPIPSTYYSGKRLPLFGTNTKFIWWLPAGKWYCRGINSTSSPPIYQETTSTPLKITICFCGEQ